MQLTWKQPRRPRRLARCEPCIRPHQEEVDPDEPEPGAALQQPVFQAAVAAGAEPEMGHIVPPLPARRLAGPQRALAPDTPETAGPATSPPSGGKGPRVQGLDAAGVWRR